MVRIAIFIFCFLWPVLGIGSVPLTAQEDKKPQETTARCILYTQAQPIILEVTIVRADLPKRWEAVVLATFTQADTNGNGRLDEDESFPSLTTAKDWLLNGRQGNPARSDIKAKDWPMQTGQAITPKVLQTYYAPLLAQTLELRMEIRQDPMLSLQDELIRELAGEAAPVLRKAHLQALPRWLKERDTDGDDCLSLRECLPRFAFADWEKRPRERMPAYPAKARWLSTQNAMDELAIDTLFIHYDINRNYRLERSEIGFSDPVFQRLDQNRDGSLSYLEMGRWLEQSPVIRWKPGADSLTLPGITKTDPMRQLPAVLVPQRDKADWENLADVITLRTEPVHLFRWLDRDGDNRWNGREIRDWVERLAPFADANGVYLLDSRMARVECVWQTREQARQQAVSQSIDPIRVSHGVPVWFDSWDKNHDGLISVREFPGAAAEFERLDLDGDGWIDPSEARQVEKRFRKK